MNIRTMFAILFTCCSISSVAHAEIVVITNLNNPATRMFTEQVAQFFLGASNVFTPIDQSKDSPIRREFYDKVTKKSPSQVEAIWAKAVFSGKGNPPKEYSSDAAIKKAVAADATSLAYIDKASVDATVKVLLTVP